MPKRKKYEFTPEQKAKHKKFAESFVPAGVGMRRIAAKAAKQAIPRVIKVVGQKKLVKVNNPFNATMQRKRTTKPKFRIKRYR